MSSSIVFLVGFMGSGKSTVGKHLANELGYTFIDLDQIIEIEAKMPITEIFSRQGEMGFREQEKKALRSLQDMHLIVATGGGTPCFFDNMQWMNDHGITVYLNCSVDTLFNRLQTGQAERPLIKGFNADELRAFISKKIEERNQFYLQSQIILMDIKDLSAIVRNIKYQLAISILPSPISHLP